MKAGQSPGNPQLSALWIVDPQAAARKVAIVVAGSKSKADAARTLGVGLKTLWTWLKRPELKELRP